MEFFTSIPAKAIMPTMAVNESEFPVKSKIKIAPIIPKGITESTINVLLKDVLTHRDSMVNVVPSYLTLDFSFEKNKR